MDLPYLEELVTTMMVEMTATDCNLSKTILTTKTLLTAPVHSLLCLPPDVWLILVGYSAGLTWRRTRMRWWAG